VPLLADRFRGKFGKYLGAAGVEMELALLVVGLLLVCSLIPGDIHVVRFR
jgi:hypothetical protein